MRNPEMTKKTSTPTKPPGTPGTAAWNSTTARTATARSPSMSGRNPGRGPCRLTASGYERRMPIEAGAGRRLTPSGVRCAAQLLQRENRHGRQVTARHALGEEVGQDDQGQAGRADGEGT